MSGFRDQGLNITGNKGRHEHIGNPCQTCGEIVINPILSQEDFETRQHKADADKQANDLHAVIEIMCACLPCPLDYMLMDLASCTGKNWPPYVLMIGDAYNSEPPHCRNNSATNWWVMP